MKIELKPVKIKDRGKGLWAREEVGRSVEATYEAFHGGITMKLRYVGESLDDIKKKLKSRKVYVVFEEVEK